MEEGEVIILVERQYLSSAEDFVERLKKKEVTSLDKNPFKEFWVCECPHCRKNIVLFHATEKEK